MPKRPVAPVAENHGDGGHQPTNDVPAVKKRSGPLTARDRSERWILAILLNEPHRWTHVQHEVSLQQFSDESRRKLAELYWHQQRDEGEVMFAEFLAGLNDPDLNELAVSLIEEAASLEADERLKEAIFFLTEEAARDEKSKHLATLRRSCGSEVDANLGENLEASDPNDVFAFASREGKTAGFKADWELESLFGRFARVARSLATGLSWMNVGSPEKPGRKRSGYTRKKK